MCVIIEREPNIEIDSSKIISACTVNPDGYGLVVFDRGKKSIIKGFNPNGNNPDTILKHLEDTKNQKILLHLRYATAGDKNKRNCHPFTVLTKKTDGLSIGLMHNGTLHPFKDDSKNSDTLNFVKNFVTPVLRRFSKTIDPETLLRDPLTLQILEEFIPLSSIVTLFDENGLIYTFNKKKGDDHDGWWSSNSYSFNSYHRTNTYSNTYQDRTNNQRKVETIKQPSYNNNNNNNNRKATTADLLKRTNSSQSIRKNSYYHTSKDMKNLITLEEKAVPIEPTARVKLTNHFTEDEIKKLTGMSFNKLEDLVLYYPDEAVQIMAYFLKKEYKNAN